MTQLINAKNYIITKEMKYVAESEGLSPEEICHDVAKGITIIPCNMNHKNINPLGIGRGLRTKVNANIGTSMDVVDIELELAKLRIALDAGADTVMDLSTGGDLNEIRKLILKESNIPVGTVPIYQAAVEIVREGKTINDMTADAIFEVIAKHAEDGVDFITVHCGVTLEALRRLKKQGRITDIVSRGGAFLAQWMIYHRRENPLYEQYDRLLEIAKEYDVTLSLGDGLRPGCLADATDRAQVQELITLGELAERAKSEGVQVMIEGPGHVPLNQIVTNIELQKQICKGAPFYVLGPLVTDIAPGYDHITSAIGGAIAAMAGADFLCYVTPSEHLKLPSLDDVKEGVIASRIAAHAADIAKGVKGAIDRDKEMAVRRKKLDWNGQIAISIDPERARKLREQGKSQAVDVCTMCAEFCAMKAAEHLKEFDPLM